MRRLGPPVGRDATELARSAICRAGPLTSRGTRPPIVHDRIQDHHHPRTTTTKCGGSIAQHDRVPSTDRLNGDVPDVRPHVCVCAATRLRHTGRGSARDLLFSPTRPPRKDRHTRGYKEAELGGRRGCARDGRDATVFRYSDATTCPRVDGSDAVGARSLSNLQGPQDDEGEERGEGCWRRSQFNPVQASARWLSEPALPGPWAPVGLGKNYSAALSFKGAARRLGGLRTHNWWCCDITYPLSSSNG